MAYQNKIYDLLVLLLLLESTCFAARFLPPTANVTAVEGSPMDVICESDNREPIMECIFTVHGFFGRIKIFEGVINKKYEFVGKGFSKGQCGLRLLSVKRENAGSVTCSLAMMSNTMQGAKTYVTVLYPIEELKIRSNNIYYEYEENEQMEFTCTAQGGFPEPVLFLLINDHQILNSTSKELFWKGPAEIENNRLILACCADQLHSLLPRTPTNCGTRTLTVSYSPRMENRLHEMEVPVVIGQDAIATVKILANPWPYLFELTKNGEMQDIPMIINKMNETVVEYAWNISKVQLLDIDSDWRFAVTNRIGNTSVQIKLSQQTSNPKTTTSSPDEIQQMSYNIYQINGTNKCMDLKSIWILCGVAALLVALLLFLLYGIFFGRPKLVETEAKEQFRSSSHKPLLSGEKRSLTASEWYQHFKIISANEELDLSVNNSLTDGWRLMKAAKCNYLYFYKPFTVRLFYNNAKRQYVLMYNVQSTWLLRRGRYQSMAVKFAKDAVDLMTKNAKNNPLPPALIIVGVNLGGTLAQKVTVALKYSDTNFHAHCFAFGAPSLNDVVAHHLNNIDDINKVWTQEILALNKVIVLKMPEELKQISGNENNNGSCKPKNQAEVLGEQTLPTYDSTISMNSKLEHSTCEHLKETTPTPTEDILTDSVIDNNNSLEESSSGIDKSDFQNGINDNIQLQGTATENAEKGIKLQEGNTIEKLKAREIFFMIATRQRNDDADKADFFGEETLPTYDSRKIMNSKLRHSTCEQLKETTPTPTEDILTNSVIDNNNSLEESSSGIDKSDFQNGINDNIQLQGTAIENAEKVGTKLQDYNAIKKSESQDSFTKIAARHRNYDADPEPSREATTSTFTQSVMDLEQGKHVPEESGGPLLEKEKMSPNAPLTVEQKNRTLQLYEH